jgi:hypothetical protein
MSIFSDIGNAVASPFKSTGGAIGAGVGFLTPAGPLLGGIAGNEIDEGMKGPQQGPPIPTFDEANAANQAAGAAADTQTQKLGQLRDQAKKSASDFSSNLPSYLQNQVSSASDSSRLNLANDLYNVKANSNARGLLYSGVNEGNQSKAKANRSSELAGQIQDINTKANAQSDALNKNASDAELSYMSADTANKRFAASTAAQKAAFDLQRQQTAYQQALQQVQNQHQFFGDLFGGAASIGGLAVAGA